MNTITEAALYRLMSWLSPFYPVGGFSYSHGLDYAVEAGLVKDSGTLKLFVETVLTQAAGRSDAVLFAAAWRAVRARMEKTNADSAPLPPHTNSAPLPRRGRGRGEGARETTRNAAQPDAALKSRSTFQPPVEQSPLTLSSPLVGERGKVLETTTPSFFGQATASLDEIADLALAWRGSRETALESEAQGTAFLATTRAAWPTPLLEEFARDRASVAFPVAVAVASAAHRVPLAAALAAYLHAFASILVSAGMRLIPLGQSDGQDIVAQLEAAIAACGQIALEAPLETVGTAAPLIDWCSMRHETQYTRLFRS